MLNFLATQLTLRPKCEKHSKKEEALQKLRGGTKFDDVAREFSEDKARQGSFNLVAVLPSFRPIEG